MAPVDPSDLLAHATWLRQLARSLVRDDRPDADDLVQDTWVAALRRPPDADRGVRPWLRTVVTNVARLRWRGDSHRSTREHVAATLEANEAPSSEELLERHELQQLLARLVSELDEPFRSTILLRFAEGLAPTQIARRLAIPASTVRWRLKEALARLRARLDALHRGDRRAWLGAFAPLAAPRSSAASPVVPLAIVATMACAILAWLAIGGAPRLERNEHRAAVMIAHAPPMPSASALEWLAQEGAPKRSLRGRVVYNGTPAARAVVRLIADPLPAREIVTDDGGRFDFGEQLPREYIVGASLPGTLAAIAHVDLRDPNAAREIELVLGDCVTSLYGKVVDASGTPIVGAEVLREGVIGSESDAAGNYDVCVLPTAALVAEIRVVVRADGFGTVVSVIAPAGRVQQDFVLAPEAAVAGHVIAVDGAPVGSARVTLELTEPAAAVPPERGVSVAAVTDGDGEFRIAGLATGEYRISAASSAAVATPIAVTVTAGESKQIELRVSPTGVVRGRVVARGTPIGGVTVAAGSEAAISQQDGTFVLARVPVGDVELATTPYKRTSGAIRVVQGDRNTAEIVVEPLGVVRGTIRRHGVPVAFARVGIVGPSRVGLTADAAGHYEARGLEPGTYSTYCDDRRLGAMFAEDRAINLGAGETREHDIELAWGGAIAGRVVDGHGNPVRGAEVRMQGRMTSKCLTNETGAFTCGSLSGDSYTPLVLPGGGAAYPFRFVEAPAKLALRDGDARIDGVRLVVEPTLLAIEGTVTDAAGAPVPDVAVHAFMLDRRRVGNFRAVPGTITDGDGHFQIRELSPGEYHVEVASNGKAARRAITAGTTNVSLVLDRSPCDAAHGHELPAELVRAHAIWNQQIELIGWSLPAAATVGKPFELTLVYRALQPIERDWTIFAHFDSAVTRLNADHNPATGWCPTSSWRAGETIVDRVTTQFEEPGRYALTIGFFTGKAPNWINLAPESGVHIADVVVKER